MSDKWKGTVYENTHRVLGGVLRTVDDETRPPPPYHLCGPRPVCGVDSLLAIGLGCCERARPLVREEFFGDYDAAVKAAQNYAAVRAKPRPPNSRPNRELTKILDEHGGLHRSRANPAPVANMLCTAASNGEWRHTDRMVDSIYAIAIRVAKALTDTPDQLRKFILNLDRWLVTGECREMLQKYKAELAPRLSEVLFRADRGNGTAGHFLFRLDSGGLGLITKPKRRFQVFTGDRDSLIATLPSEELMEAALRALT